MFLRAILVLSLACVALPLVLPEPVWRDLSLLAFSTGSASLILLLRGGSSRTGPRRHRTGQPSDAKPIVIDGSNVMHWRDEVPQIATVREVVATLTAQGYALGVVFDANAGYKMMDRYLDDRPLARMLKLPVDRVLVVPKGSPADPIILLAAREQGACIVSNDRYRDHAETHPEVLEPGTLVRGGYRNGQLWLDLSAA
ncbi:MAG: hypothetical protein JXR75_02900 [Rhodobacteraceae bacterium]|nr:hypothetical protein [Paracoccaceae bacterium]